MYNQSNTQLCNQMYNHKHWTVRIKYSFLLYNFADKNKPSDRLHRSNESSVYRPLSFQWQVLQKERISADYRRTLTIGIIHGFV